MKKSPARPHGDREPSRETCAGAARERYGDREILEAAAGLALELGNRPKKGPVREGLPGATRKRC